VPVVELSGVIQNSLTEGIGMTQGRKHNLASPVKRKPFNLTTILLIFCWPPRRSFCEGLEPMLSMYMKNLHLLMSSLESVKVFSKW
jgi:hypothetical protein